MNSITEYLHQIQALTNKNLKILSALNEAFYTRKHHLSVSVGDEQYVIPSFLSIENKLNSLQANFENLVNAPSTGEAYMTFDGNTQKMQMMGYSQTPHHVDLETVTNFNWSANDIFKDFITPNVYITFDLPEIDNCTKTLNVKKVALISNEAKSAFSSYLNGDTSKTISYGDYRTMIYNFTEDVDYIEYDRLYRMDLRQQTAVGTYEIREIISKAFNDNYLELYTLKLNTLKYYIDNGTIERTIQVGDELVTNNDSAKLKVLAVRPVVNEIDIEVLNNAYADLGDTSTGVPDMYTLHYFRSINFDSSKYVNVPLEEDRYILVFIAPVNDTTNIRAYYGDGVVIDTYKLSNDTEGTFEDFYTSTVNNVGDKLFGITSMISHVVENLSQDEFNYYTSIKPEIDPSLITVTQINKHLNNSETVKNIRELYEQKSRYKSELNTIQNDIDKLNTKLATVSFDDTKNSKKLYKNELDDLNERKDNIVAAISSIVQEIAQSVNNSDVPIENAKYHIRGFIYKTDPNHVDQIDPTFDKVVKLDVEYRYKNRNKFTGNAETIAENYIFSDWNKMESIFKLKTPTYNNGKYLYEYENTQAMNNQNLIKWNQIDIPISQGESVDIRVRYIYEYGYPFVETRSDWSEIYNVEFPEEYTKNLSVLDIIEENNNDVKNDQLRSLLVKEGIIQHVNNKVDDQDVRYFHTPDKISSGFYTPERRIIPLYDKLKSFDDIIGRLQTEVLGATSDNLIVTLYDNDHKQVIDPFTTNTFNILDYTSNTERGAIFNGALIDCAYTQITVDFYNAGVYDMKLFTSFPGNPYNTLSTTRVGCNGMNSLGYVDNVEPNYTGVFWQTNTDEAQMQKENQWIYYRICSVYDSSDVYYVNKPDLIQTSTGMDIKTLKKGQCPPAEPTVSNSFNDNRSDDGYFITAWPIDNNLIDSNNTSRSANMVMSCQCAQGDKFIVLRPGEHIQSLIGVYYKFNGNNYTEAKTVMSFDIRTSLYNDPTNYEFIIRASKDPELISKTQRIQAQVVNLQTPNPYNIVLLDNASKKIQL